MATTLHVVDGVQAEPKPNAFQNPFAHTVADPSSGGLLEKKLSTTAGSSGIDSAFGHPTTLQHYRICRAYSNKLNGAQTISVQTVTCTVTGFEHIGTDNAEWEVCMFVWKADDTGIRGNIGHTNGGFIEMGTTNSETSNAFTSTSVSALDSDRICVEIYFNLTGAKTGTTDNLHYNDSSATLETKVEFATDTLSFQTEITTTLILLGEEGLA